MKEKLEFWIIAGVNGAGKTTIVQQELKEITNQITYINPDSFVKEIQQNKPVYNLETANYAALKKTREILIQCLRNRQSVAVETTLSSTAYAKYAAFAKENGVAPRRRRFFVSTCKLTELSKKVTYVRPIVFCNCSAERCENCSLFLSINF